MSRYSRSPEFRNISCFIRLFKKHQDVQMRPSDTISNKSCSSSCLSCNADCIYKYFCRINKKYSQKIISMKTKMKLIASLKIWVVIYPSITLFFYLFGKELSAMPIYQRTFLLTISLVPWIVFVGVPFVDSIIRVVSTKTAKSK